MSVKAMWMMIQKIHAESHVSRLFILFDMVWCAVHYGVGYLEYRVFGWVYIRGKKRKTFMTMQDNLRVCRLANDKAYLPLFEDKLQFNENSVNLSTVISWTCGKPLLRNFKLSAKAIR